MKLLLTALCASFMVVPAFASECEGGKCDKEKEKKEEGALAHCGKCEGDKEHDKDKDKEKEKEVEVKEAELLLASDCEKGECDKDKKKEEGALA